MGCIVQRRKGITNGVDALTLHKSSITSPDVRDMWAFARAIMTFFFAAGIARLSKEEGFQTMALISATTNSTIYISMTSIQ